MVEGKVSTPRELFRPIHFTRKADPSLTANRSRKSCVNYYLHKSFLQVIIQTNPACIESLIQLMMLQPVTK